MAPVLHSSYKKKTFLKQKISMKSYRGILAWGVGLHIYQLQNLEWRPNRLWVMDSQSEYNIQSISISVGR